MIDGMSDFRDYYSGMGHFSLNQMFIAEPCEANNYCVLHPNNGGYGSIFSTEGFRSANDHGVDPGYWFVGIYNDVSATGPIKDFTLSFKQEFSYQDTQCAGMYKTLIILYYSNTYTNTNTQVRPIATKDFWVRSVETCVQVL